MIKFGAALQKLKDIKSKVGEKIKLDRFTVGAFVLSFVLMLTFIDVTLKRNAVIRTIKTELFTITTRLNEVGIDIAYDKIEFDNVFIYPLMIVKNLRLYNLKGENLWEIKLNELSARPKILSNGKIKIYSEAGAEFKYNDKVFYVKSSDAEIIVKLVKNKGIQEVELYLDGTNIKDFAKIKKVTMALRLMDASSAISVLAPSVESHLELEDITINGLIDYPLTSNIRRIYSKVNLMGIFEGGDILIAAENWLQKGGFIDVSNLIVSWEPLLLVGRGDIRFSESFEPRVQLQTSSKAMLRLLSDLQKNKFLERKGVFVANILLGAKAFKLKEDDEHYTISTPITYRDGKLAIENITIKTVKP